MIHRQQAERQRLAKAELRSGMRALRATIRPDIRTAAEKVLSEIDLSELGSVEGVEVSGYCAIDSELSPQPLFQRLEPAGAKLSLPCIGGRKTDLVFRRWRLGDPLIPGRWGILEPAQAAMAVTPSLMIVPLLAFDKSGSRLGYGGGYYDRAIAQLRAAGTVVTVGLAFDQQEVDAVPILDYDQPLDWVITQSGLRKFVGS